MVRLVDADGDKEQGRPPNLSIKVRDGGNWVKRMKPAAASVGLKSERCAMLAPHVSALGGRARSARTAARGSIAPLSKASTLVAIGMSTPRAFAISINARAV